MLGFYATIVIQWFHVLLGIFWFGSAIYRNLFLLPAILRLPPEQQRAIGLRLWIEAEQVIAPVGLFVIGLGIIRGTVVGQITSIDALLTTYGFTWLAGLCAALLVFSWSIFVVGSAVENWLGDDELWQLAPAGVATIHATEDDDDEDEVQTAASVGQRIRTLGYVELGGFAVVFTCMILMRFGY